MSSRKINPTLMKSWRAAVSTLSESNGALEVTPLNAEGQRLPHIRGRLLSVDEKDGSLVVEKPANQPQAVALRKGVAVEIVVILGSTRLRADAVVADLGRYSLNKQTKVMAIKLGSVTGVASAQRRACFRLSTAGLKLKPVRLNHEGWTPGQTPLETQLIDLSDRGLGVGLRMELDLAEKMIGQVFEVTVDLPGEDGPLKLDGRVVRVVDEGHGLVTLGMQIEYVTVAEQRRVEQIVQQFSVEQQRKQIRRLRGAG